MSLPGVGQHLQDHISTEVTFGTTAETAATMHASAGASSVSPYVLFLILYLRP